MHEPEFYRCPRCGSIVGLIHGPSEPLSYCGGRMERLVPGVAEASAEKHLPAVKAEGDRVHVCVGTAAHPMEDSHSIQWVYLLTDQGGQRKNLRPGAAPEVTFALADEKPLAVYAYCNLHGLWKTEL